MIKKTNSGFTLIEIMIVVVIIGIVVAIALPNYFTSSKKSKQTTCIANLTKIDAAIDQWVLDENISPGAAISESDADAIYSIHIKGGRPVCPSGGTYAFHEVGGRPQVTCSKEDEGHKLP
ncbi:MAG: prepilin-type N-terminal cleavage/methylation domain-containing protein [Candidatus Omnitrophica bacterium]|nr:prepilin-type N-terminal cleavage/methylation domain-containing protein [Candidatus Omnitrophota bacterium]